ncbi:MAG: hypothetical protein GYB31_07530 [Bacteroidetes bacterium]|nr:hypothetical protein [Bacteroidota bacterium]
MHDSQRFSLLAFPQFFDGNNLSLNIVVIPRTQNPLSAAIEGEAGITDAPAFANADLAFTANIFNGLSVYPHTVAPFADIDLVTNSPANAPDIFAAMANHLEVTAGNGLNTNANLKNGLDPKHRPESAVSEARSVKKYLPKTYRSAFNFTSPKTKNAVTDDSYHCAVKDAKKQAGFSRDTNVISWGKVFAYLLRQPQLAREAGMIYQTSLPIEPEYFEEGGWLFIDLADGSDYSTQLNEEPNFIKRYAAKIPPLVPGEARQVFAPVLFPVALSDATGTPPGYDELFIEAGEYNDGFAKIVHCMQPVNRDILIEENDGHHPVKDAGIRLGWDDEQILIWYMRQMVQHPDGTESGRLDAPLGVFGYNIDVKLAETPDSDWESLTRIESRNPLVLTRSKEDNTNPILIGDFEGELPFQVYPSQLDGDKNKEYWLPMYFGSWNGKSMILPDPDAADIYQTNNPDVEDDPEDPLNDTGTGVDGQAQNQLNQMYQSGPISIDLRYGENYAFRVRMQDISGGSPGIERVPINETSSDITTCKFKRYISPNQPRIQEFEPTGDNSNEFIDSDTPVNVTELNIQRPKLGYPAVVYTGKYHDPIDRLIQQSTLGITFDENDHSVNAEHRVGLGIADPDVDRLEITVEAESLKMDKHGGVSGRDDFVHLYTTHRSFPAIHSDDDYEAILNIPVEYVDVKVIHTGSETDIEADFDLPEDMDNLTQLVLPTARKIRLTIRAVCESKADDQDYYGFIGDANVKLDNRYGEPFEVMAYHPSTDEQELIIQTPGVPMIQGIFMRSDVISSRDGTLQSVLFGSQSAEQPNNVQQLAERLGLESNGLSLMASKGERVVFGCSSRIRHTLSPDHSSLTLASKSDLINHWLVCVSFEIDRDWMWDALQTQSFIIRSSKRFSRDAEAQYTDAFIGDIEMIRTASFESLMKANRNSTRLIFIDAIEPKKLPVPTPQNPDPDPDFPDTIELNYSIEPRFKIDHGAQQDPAETFELILPITNIPAQVPKIVSAGFALSPYSRSDDYSETTSRKRYLWIEFAEPVEDPNDTYFARVLANSPDQLISNNNPELLVAPDEPAIPLDPEYIRVISPESANDLAGINAMQPMEKSTDSDRHYLLPVPAGLHSDSDEMFGFFTYEFRVGHYRDTSSEEGQMVWSTAQGRFGRRQRVTGIQHPAPILTCAPNRDESKLWVTAPYAVAVHDGKNVTADPPRTQLWALLYAQVKQADNLDYRNILLDDRPLDWRVRVQSQKDKTRRVVEGYAVKEASLLQEITVNNFAFDVNPANFSNVFKLAIPSLRKNKNATKFGTTAWTNKEVQRLLGNCGLPANASLSVIVVETLPHITNIFEHVSNLQKPRVSKATAALLNRQDKVGFSSLVNQLDKRAKTMSYAGTKTRQSPVDEGLGEGRILRTSRLTPVPDVCCTDC